MDFEWAENKHKSNKRKHGIDFRTAAKVFLDPYLLEFDERDAAGEFRHNAIGMVDDRVLSVTYTLRGDTIGAEPHEKRKYHEV